MASPENIHVGAGNTILNPDTVPVDLGLSADGATIKYKGELKPIEVDQYLAAVGYFIPGEECEFETLISESSASKLKYILGYGTVTTQAAGAGQVGYEQISFGGNTVLTDYVLEYVAPLRTNRALNIRVRLHKVNISPNFDIAFQKDKTTGYKLNAKAVCDTTKAAGNQLGYYRVETAVATDGSPAQLAVSSTTPTDGATGVAVNSAITVVFNRAIHPDGVHSGNFILMKDDGTQVSVTVTQTGVDTVTITPASNLATSTTYLLTISKSCMALSDYTQMAANVIKDFTTAS